jgi:MarR family transcriptional regulator, organic hydroperoxide resistance regulator
VTAQEKPRQESPPGEWPQWDPDALPPHDAPLPALLGVANRLMSGYWWHTTQVFGLSPAGLGVVRLLAVHDGLKSSEVASHGSWSASTITAVVDTLVRDGFVERRRDEADRRVVRLYLTPAGRQRVGMAMDEIGPRWHGVFDYIDPDDEPVIRKFLVDTIERFSKLVREERCR